MEPRQSLTGSQTRHKGMLDAPLLPPQSRMYCKHRVLTRMTINKGMTRLQSHYGNTITRNGM